MEPSDLVQGKFLERTIHGGVAPKMLSWLGKVEADLRTTYAAVNPGVPFKVWCGDNGIGGWRLHGGKHTDGVAIDLAYDENPYVVTRNGTKFGGEYKGRSLKTMRAAFAAACDRMVGGYADISGRKPDESTGSVWDRFNAVSNAWKAYFRPYFKTDAIKIERKPVKNYLTAPIEAFSAVASELLPGVTFRDVPIQVLRDYETVRVPTVFGDPAEYPSKTRNPARGFMTIPRHVAIALCVIGRMRWGICDFGDEENGDVMHFDSPGSRSPL
jgi:hypothetical protein